MNLAKERRRGPRNLLPRNKKCRNEKEKKTFHYFIKFERICNLYECERFCVENKYCAVDMLFIFVTEIANI